MHSKITNIDACLSDEDAARVNRIKAFAEADLAGNPLSQDILFLIEKLDRALGDAEVDFYRE